MSKEEIKKTRKFLSFNKPIESSQIISPKLVFVPAFGGGVSGNVKLKMPSASDAIAVSLNVLTNELVCSQAIHPIIKPATIQPRVPNTRMFAKSFSALVTCLNEIAFTNASVGIYNIM